MRVAIIGGGASGLITAYLLDGVHEVDLFEKQQTLGGSVRTLGGNARCPAMSAKFAVENGVTGFHSKSSPCFRRLLNRLGVAVRTVSPSTGLFLLDRPPLALPTLETIYEIGMRKFFMGRADARRFGLRLLLFIAKLKCLPDHSLTQRTLGEYLPSDVHSLAIWLRCLMMECYSTPRQSVDQIPAVLAIPTLRTGLTHSHWFVIVGGVYTYMQRILDQIHARVHVGASVQSIQRDTLGVTLSFHDATERRYDKVVLAVTPGQILPLMGDPCEEEVSMLAPWSDQQARTKAHTDTAFYGELSSQMSIFDFFEATEGRMGYNCNLNAAYGIEEDVRYSFSLGLDELIDPDRVLDDYHHTVPVYTVDAITARQALIARNGINHTYFTGAYLGNGLHEGATVSAMRVAQLLGGHRL